MKLNFKNLLKFLIPIFGLMALCGYYRYRYVLNPDGLINSKGELYRNEYGTFLDYPKFVNKCLTFEQDSSAISYGYKGSYGNQRVTLKGYGSLINSCRHDVLVERISMKNRIGDLGRFVGIVESSQYPNEGMVAEIDKDYTPKNYIYFYDPEGNILKANSSLKIEVTTTDTFYEKSSFIFHRTIPKKNTPIKFKLNKDSENPYWWNYKLKLNEDNFDSKKLAEDGLAVFRFYFKNPHGQRLITFEPNKCIVFINGKLSKDDCRMKKWQLRINGRQILNSKDFGKYIYK